MYALYTNNLILADYEKEEIDHIIKDLNIANLVLTIVGDIQNFLGVGIHWQDNGTISLTQTNLIYQIVTNLHLANKNMKIRDTPGK